MSLYVRLSTYGLRLEDPMVSHILPARLQLWARDCRKGRLVGNRLGYLGSSQNYGPILGKP